MGHYHIADYARGLQRLHLGHISRAWNVLSDDAMACILASSPLLRYLGISCCTALTDRTCEEIGKLKDLKELVFTGNYNISTVGVCNMIERLGSSLLKVSLASCEGLEDECLWALAQHCASLHTLDVSGCGFTSAAVGWMLELGMLRHLALARMPNLHPEVVDLIGFHGQTLRSVDISAVPRLPASARGDICAWVPSIVVTS